MSAASLQPPPAILPVSVDDATLAGLAEQPAAGTPSAQAAHLAALAWHLRQRDGRRALALAAEAEQLLQNRGGGLAAAPEAAAYARLLLVRAEAAWLHADLPQAEGLCQAASQHFACADDLRGSSDAACVLAHVVFDAGRFVDARAHMLHAQRLAEQAGDTARADGTLAVLANWSMLGDVAQAEREHAPLAARLCASADPRVAMWAHEFFGHLHARRGRHVQSIAAFSTASDLARQAGQGRRAVVCCCNVAASYSNLNDHQTALEWIARALQLARPAGWPASIGLCLMMTGNSLFLLERLDASQAALEEAATVLQALPPASRSRLLVSFYRVTLMLAQGDAEGAAALAATTRAAATAAGLVDVVCDSQRALAQALLKLGRRDEALAAAEEALQLAQHQGGPTRCIDALLVLAELHAPVDDPPRASLPHLLQALAHGRSIDDHTIPAETLDAAAREYALQGDLVQAYALAREANAARDQQQAMAASDRSLALDARRETDRLHTEAQSLREQARAQDRHAAQLRQANATLGQLGAIGQEIAAQLDIDSVFARVYERLGSLLDLQHLAIWLLDEDGQLLHLRLGLEAGQALAAASVALDSPVSQAARCARTGQELLQLSASGPPDSNHMPGTLHTRSALFGPLRVRDRIIGVLSIQSQRADSYGKGERLVFRSVCDWAAVALDNAAAMSQLGLAQQQLQAARAAEQRAREAAELATQRKGEFLANISHDLRTPLASLHGYLETLLLRGGEIDAADRRRFLNAALAQSDKVSRLMRELLELARLESGFVQVAARSVPLPELVHDVLRKLELAAAQRSQRLQCEFEPGLPPAWADVGMVERVLTNLLDNAIVHAPAGSQVCVRIGAAGAALWVEVLDSGPGIPPELQPGLFNRPAAVTQAHRPGGGGLGLVIVQRLLQHHGSQIALVQRAGWGAAFRFTLAAAD